MFDQETRLGFGTYSLTGDEGRATVEAALDAGYRHVDTARLYGNEAAVGDAIDAAEVDREDLFVATKVAHFEEPEKTEEYVRTAVEESFDRLGLDRIDLLYHHWPRSQEDIETVLPVLAEYADDGAVANLGVSNYTVADLELARDLVDAPVAANQVEMHPLLPQTELRDYLADRETELVAYSPLAQGEVFEVDAITETAEKHGVSAAVASLAWLLEKGVAPIPRSSTVDHLRDNRRALDVDLDAEDVERIDAVDRRHRCEDPDWMSW
ncbi:aldo/keto reductase [Halostella sp. JP-L12]|uniref:aldo/keto reductase n=1 Tax=Halostella TaxID=1843185 RepID=UPI000EF8483D|nr:MULTISPECIES: aldo/keto reductase [Halostella]NHN47859.1 aldo/keto reductase [Halostella sp. JP-L12]